MNAASPRRKRMEASELIPLREKKAKNSPVDSKLKVCAQQLKSKHRMQKELELKSQMVSGLQPFSTYPCSNLEKSLIFPNFSFLI